MSIERPYLRLQNGKFITINASGQTCLFDQYGNLLLNLENVTGGGTTVNAGTVTITAGTTEVIFAHGLGRIPKVGICPMDDLGGISFWATADATNLYVYIHSQDLSNHTFQYFLV